MIIFYSIISFRSNSWVERLYPMTVMTQKGYQQLFLFLIVETFALRCKALNWIISNDRKIWFSGIATAWLQLSKM